MIGLLLLVGCLPSHQHASVSQGQIYSILRSATLRWKLQTKLSISPSHSILKPGQPVPAPQCQFSSHWYDPTPKKSRRKRDSNPGSPALEADALTTRPMRRSGHDRNRSLHTVGSCRRHSEITNEMHIPLRLIPKESTVCCWGF